MLRASVAGRPLPADGARVAAYQEPLLRTARCSRRRCPEGVRPSTGAEIIAHHQKSSDSVVCSGYGLTPCQHSRRRPDECGFSAMRIPLFRPRGSSTPEARPQTQSYLAATSVTPMGIGAAKEFLTTLADDDGAIKSDTGSVPDLASSPQLESPGLCRIGRRDAVRVRQVFEQAWRAPAESHEHLIGPPVGLRRGDASAVHRALLRSTVGYSVVLVAMSAMAVGVWVLAGLMVTP